MDIPKFWRRVDERVSKPDGGWLQLRAWGWSSESEAAALDLAKTRLRNLVSRVRNQEPLPRGYAYGSRPIREEVLEEIRDAQGRQLAVVTRNGYGSRVLNADRLLFIDVDRKKRRGIEWLRGRFSGARPRRSVGLDQLCATLERFAPMTFRVYQTAAGLRAVSVSHTFQADGPEARDLLTAAEADPAFVHLCRVQKSFRARLTPKFWRCRMRGGPPPYPREDVRSQEAFHRWLREYERCSLPFATCSYVETVGSRSVHPDNAVLLQLHDRETRVGQELPLA